MRLLAPGVHLIALQPAHAINAYLIGDVLIDAGTRQSAKRLRAVLKGTRLRGHALTHAHPDHQGASRDVCRHFGVPLWASEQDAAVMASGDLSGNIPTNVLTRVQNRLWTGPSHPVERALREGDDLNGFEVLHTPGHAPGHLAFWRASDRVLILGDVLANIDFMTMRERLREPPGVFTVDRALNRESIRRLVALNPRVVAFGHGRPILNADEFQRKAVQLWTRRADV